MMDVTGDDHIRDVGLREGGLGRGLRWRLREGGSRDDGVLRRTWLGGDWWGFWYHHYLGSLHQ